MVSTSVGKKKKKKVFFFNPCTRRVCITVSQTVIHKTICKKKSFFPPSSLPEVKPTLYPLPLYPASSDIRGGTWGREAEHQHTKGVN